MKKTIILTGLILLASNSVAVAQPKFMDRMWWPSHWKNQDFQPYYEDAQTPHNSQWSDYELNKSNWTAKEWVSLDGGDGKALIQKWQNADIIRKNYMKKDVAHLEVGPNFYHLGGADKRRVIETVDAIYARTEKTPKTILLKDWRSNRIIGEYTKSSLVLQ